MPFFRKTFDLSYARTRHADSADIPILSRLLRYESRRFLGASVSDLPALVASAPSIVLVNGRDVWGIVLASWPIDDSAWIRALALVEGIPSSAALDMLFAPLYKRLEMRGVRRLFYAGDSAADHWLQPAFLARDWVRQTDVVVYEKEDHVIPSNGNPSVRVRHAQPVDLQAILTIDRHSFDAQWVKEEAVLAPSIAEQPFFVVAELEGTVVGYAFATSHFSGRLVHLVRIAVDPSVRGQAVGVRLMAEVVEFAKRYGANTITLNTQEENHTAQRLYEWFGFQRTGESQTVLRRDL